VSGASIVVGANANVATLLAELSVTVPVGATQGIAQESVKLAAPEIGAIGSLKVAVTFVIVETSAAPSSGVTATTVGAGGIVATPVPRIGSRLPLHAANRKPANVAKNGAKRLHGILDTRIELLGPVFSARPPYAAEEKRDVPTDALLPGRALLSKASALLRRITVR